MAAVYGGTHRNGLEVAIKILHDGLASRHDVGRFRREARLANAIRHPGVVRFTDDDVTEDGSIFMVMDLLEGHTVQERAKHSGRKLPLTEVVFIAHRLLDVLKATHAQGIAHRDIKPGNLFITRMGDLRVLDFGIACFFEDFGAASTTRSGRAMGTPAFMAPEQALGHIHAIDGRTDIWAVGATMFSLLSGRFVHEADCASEVLVRAGSERARRIREVAPGLPRRIGEVIDRALAFDKTKRWPDAGAMEDALLRACEPLLGAPLAKLAFSAPDHEPHTDIREATTQGAAPKRRIPRKAEPWRSWSTPTPAASFEMSAARLPRKRVARWLAVAATAFAVGCAGFAFSRLAAATALVMSSQKVWLDGNIEQARARAEDALAADSGSAGAHLALLRAGPVWPNGIDRAHFFAAQEERKQLTDAERRYLQALAPAMSVPPDFRLSAERLEALHRADPDDLGIRVALAVGWMRVRRLDEAKALLQPLADAPDARGIVLASLGLVQAMRDDVDAARTMYRRCVSTFPAASSCTGRFAELELLEGHCAEAERVAHQHMEAHPRDPNARLFLAYALAARGAPAGEVRATLEQWADLRGGGEESLHRLRAHFKMALYEGRLDEASGIHERLARIIEKLDSAEDRFVHAMDGMLLNAEVGRASEAEKMISAYSHERHGLRHHSYRGDDVLYLHAYATRLGVLPWERWVQLRDEHLTHHQARDDLADGVQRNWLDAYAIPVTTAAGAREALDVLPGYLPLLPRTSRWFQHDAVLGTVFWKGGRPHDAMLHFERAAASCVHLDGPIQYVHMLLNFGAMLEERGDVVRACAMYRRVLERFPVTSGSRSAMQADSRASTVCPTNTSGDEGRLR
ncbi:protein kinase [Pendulispora albinea]|uniref:Protein kinase n=2 Tax=Pendulispora albinea TaxID=2741071 RepID=A0ABZ2MCN7_9BACT